MTTRFAVIGAGNGGQAFAGHLGLLGFRTSLYDVEPQKVAALRSAGRMRLEGAVRGEAPLPLVTGRIEDAMKGAEVLLVVVPAIHHRSLALAMAPHLRDGQAIVLSPGAVGGALEVRSVLRAAGVRAAVTVAEAETLLYACRSGAPGEVHVHGVKARVDVAALPAADAGRIAELLAPAFPQFRPAANVLVTSLTSANALMHPAPTLLNAARVDAGTAFDYYTDGITPAVARVIAALDRERLSIARALGVEVPALVDWYASRYGVSGPDLHARVQQVEAYRGIRGPATLETRYLLEDVPTGLVPLAQLGRAGGVATPTCDAVVALASTLLGRDLAADGRTLERLGLAGMGPQEIRAVVAAA